MSRTDSSSTVEATDDLDRRASSRPQLDWWHRDHPTFVALAGFFSGLAYVALAPAGFAAVLTAVFGERTAHEAFPFVVLMLVLPIVLIALPRTSRFGKYMLVGMIVTGLIVVGVAWAVFWLMARGAAS